MLVILTVMRLEMVSVIYCCLTKPKPRIILLSHSFCEKWIQAGYSRDGLFMISGPQLEESKIGNKILLEKILNNFFC